jgi:hypothetical protein
MATVNLGSIKFNWQGAYAGGTAYAVDDVVSYNGSSYVCTAASTGNLPTDTNFWDQMSGKGTDADLLNIASTVQGDLYYNNGSAIARLGAGTSGEFLKTQGTGANPVWDSAGGGKVLQVIQTTYNSGTAFTTSSSSYVDFPYNAVITPSATSSKVLILGILNGLQINNTAANVMVNVKRAISGGTTLNVVSSQYGVSHSYVTEALTSPIAYLDSPNTTSEITYTPQLRIDNTSYQGTGHRGSAVSGLILMEIGA